MTVQLRPYQALTINETYKRFSEGFKRVLVSLPTGGGKSIIVAKLAYDFVSKRNTDVNNPRTALKMPNKALIIVNRTKLAFQLQATLKKAFNIDCGMITAGSKPNYNKFNCFIAMAQTLSNRDLPPNIGLLMVDEAHEGMYFDIVSQCYNKYLGAVWKLGNCFVVGLTATPWRTNNKEGFCQYFDSKVSVTSPMQLIEDGYLTPGELFSYQFENEAVLETDAGDYTISSLTRAFSKDYAEDVVTKHKNLCRNKKTIAFTPSISSAKMLCDEFKAAGYITEVITGKDSQSARDKLFERFDVGGDIEVLVSVSTLTTGFDQPDVECVLIARPTKSVALLVQMIGRGLRLYQGKESCIIIDCGGCFQRIKKVQGKTIVNHLDLSYYRVCPISKAPMPPMVKVCEHCETEVNIFSKFCPGCGTEFKKVPKEKPTSVSFPELEKYMTEGMMIERLWIFNEVRKCFTKVKTPSNLMSKFNKKFHHLPNKDYFLHSIFGGCQSLLAQQLYSEHLKTFYSDREDLVTFFMDLEFGNPKREYFLGISDIYKRRVFLDLEYTYDIAKIRSLSEEEWKELYIKEVANGTSPRTLSIIRP